MNPTKFDPDHLYNLLGYNEEVVISMLEKIITGIKQKTVQLREALESKDTKLIKNYAHALKSNFRYLACAEISNLLKKIETEAEQNNMLDTNWQDFNQYLSKYQPILNEVEEYLDSIKKT
jgi:HPt (histidine-containing phosphotransfer) domain-containing protein